MIARFAGQRSTQRAALVARELRLLVDVSGSRVLRVSAVVDCDLHDSAHPVEGCRRCPRFARVEVQPSGAAVVCRKGEEPAEE